ncbi:MAG: FadR/GntR family transcriptional regulator [Vicinamibacteraceae bacterium]
MSGITDTADEHESGTRPLSKENLASRLQLELFSGRPPAGAKLESERQLATRYGVSRPMIREVLQALQERGLIQIMPGRGAFVRNVQLADAVRPLDVFYRQHKPTPRDLIQARLMLERETAMLAARNATDADLRALEVALRELHDARDLITRARADLAFHTVIARASRNPVIETMFGSIAKLIFEQILRSLGDARVSREGVPYHQEIFDAIRSRDGAAASAAMAGHLEVALQTYGDDLDRPLDLLAQRSVEDPLSLHRP